MQIQFSFRPRSQEILICAVYIAMALPMAPATMKFTQLKMYQGMRFFQSHNQSRARPNKLMPLKCMYDWKTDPERSVKLLSANHNVSGRAPF